jgi:hypothetical protein
MKTRIFCFALLITLATSASARFVTLVVNSNPGLGPVILDSAVTIGTNEVAQVVSSHGGGGVYLIKDGITNNVSLSIAQGNYPTVIAGPAIVQMNASDGYCTVKIEPESFPPGQTLILPAGTVGIVHVESSTNLIQWQDEWVHTFSNTNENRFFRIRAERSLP